MSDLLAELRRLEREWLWPHKHFFVWLPEPIDTAVGGFVMHRPTEEAVETAIAEIRARFPQAGLMMLACSSQLCLDFPDRLDRLVWYPQAEGYIQAAREE